MSLRAGINNAAAAFFAALLLASASVPLTAASSRAGDMASAKAPAGSQSDSKSRSHRAPQLTIKDGYISGAFDDLPLAELADAISSKAPIAIILADGSGGRLVSAKWHRVALDEAMRLILRQEDAFYFYGAEGNQAATLKAIWIYPKGRGRGLFPVPPDRWASNKDLSAGLSSKDPNVRAHTIETLLQRKGDGAMDQLMAALNDSSSEVRAEAVYAALQSGVNIPAPALKGLVHDSSPDVRFLALQASAGGPDARSTAQALASDPNEAVRSAAQAALTRMDEQEAPSVPPSTPPADEAN